MPLKAATPYNRFWSSRIATITRMTTTRMYTRLPDIALPPFGPVSMLKKRYGEYDRQNNHQNGDHQIDPKPPYLAPSVPSP
jgi:hypothetical protein